MVRRERFEIKEPGRLRSIALDSDTGYPIEKGPILQFGQAMLLGPRAAIGIVASIGLCDEDSALRVDRQSIQQRTECIDRLDESVSLGIEHI